MIPVATERTITVKVADGKMTVAELREFLAGIEQTAGNNAAVPTARVAFGGGIKSVSVTMQDDGTRDH